MTDKSTSEIPPGTTLGGRFVVERTVFDDVLGPRILARDQKTGRAVSLRLLPTAFLSRDAWLEVLRAHVKTASKLSHTNLLSTYGVGTHGKQFAYVACEWIDGAPLAHLISNARQNGTHLEPDFVHRVLIDVCNGLSYLRANGPHASLRPSTIWISTQGSALITDVGVAPSILSTVGVDAFGAHEKVWLAPEIKTGGVPTLQSDIFGVGALLYVLLTGRSLVEDFVPPSQANPQVTPGLDEVLFRCLAADPTGRYQTADELRLAIAEHLSPVSSEVDVSKLPALPPNVERKDQNADPTARVRAPGPVSTHPPAAPGGQSPRIGSRVSLTESFRGSSTSLGEQRVASAETNSAPLAAVDLAQLLAKITENDAPRWMVSKDNLDHGPFSGRELVGMILKGEVAEAHGLLNMDTGARKPAAEFPEFVEFLAQYKLKKRDDDDRVAVARSAVAEKTANLAKIAAAALVVLALGAAGYWFVFTRPKAEREARDEGVVEDLYKRGKIHVVGSAGVLPSSSRRGGRRGGRGGGHGASSNGGGSYEEAMNQAVDLGDVSRGGGEQQLAPAQVAGVMNGKLRTLSSCVGPELRNGNIGTVQIDMAIAGSGQVVGASVRQGSSEFKQCVAGKVKQIRFPSFPAPRMGARYSFSVD